MMKLDMHFSYGSQGWLESMFLDGDSYETQRPIAQKIIEWRRYLMADQVILEYAKISLTNVKKDGICIQGQPVATSYYVEEDPLPAPNNIEVGLKVRLETATGKSGNRIIRGMADALVYDNKIVGSIGAITIPTTIASPTDGQTRLAYLTGYLGVIAKASFYARKNLVDGSYTKEDWAKVLYRGIGNRKTGAPFGRTRGRRASA
jgi:hypothetical protein